jgi:hypothetical protein
MMAGAGLSSVSACRSAGWKAPMGTVDAELEVAEAPVQDNDLEVTEGSLPLALETVTAKWDIRPMIVTESVERSRCGHPCGVAGIRFRRVLLLASCAISQLWRDAVRGDRVAGQVWSCPPERCRPDERIGPAARRMSLEASQR